MSSGLRHLLLGSALAIAVATACYTGPRPEDGLPPHGGGGAGGGAAGGGGGGGSTTTTSVDPTDPEAPVNLPTGLPCDVAKLLADNCTRCHGDVLNGTAKSKLLSIDDLTHQLDGEVVANLSLERMQDDTSPMPPSGKLGADKIAILSNWIAKGMPKGSCGSAASDDAGAPTVETTCTSNKHWTGGDHGSSRMRPGAPCIRCHSTGSIEADAGAPGNGFGPDFNFAGTVFPSAHDENDCYGSDATTTTTVVLTGADGQVITLPINTAGNFYTDQTLAMPVKVKVVSAAGTRTMKDAVTVGDCNTCHTATSESPGRVVEKR